MQFSVPLPFDRINLKDQFLTMEGVRAMVQTIERAGFDSGFETDHPCPTGRWLDAGGHYAQDPFVMMAVVAAATTRLRVQTGILVLPYRNPFIVARALATLDHVSAGRVTLSVGAGYLKGEYRALGVDYEKRNELMDEYLRALRLALSGEEFSFEGSGYEAKGCRIFPGPVQIPHLPIYVGGNSRRAIRRAAELGDAWNPFMTSSAVVAATTRTAEISSVQDVADGMAYLREHCEKIGHGQVPATVVGGINKPGEKISSQELVDRIGSFRDIGVTMVGIQIDGDSRAQWCENAERLGAEVVAKFRS